MKTLKKLAIASAFALIVAAVAPVAAKADQGNWETKVTINQPLQVGDLVLTPGTYVFRLADIWAPDAVMIYNTKTQSYDGVVLGMPAHRSHASERTKLVLKEEAKGAPEALQYWYYPDSLRGIEFYYPQTKTEAPTHAGSAATAPRIAG
jgi:hypothetical protein